MSSQKKIQFPFTADGSIPHYADLASRSRIEPKYTWKDGEPFEATLTLQGFERGRSAAYFLFKAPGGASYTVFMTDLLDMIKSPKWLKGEIHATFVPCKRGKNFGVRLLSTEGE